MATHIPAEVDISLSPTHDAKLWPGSPTDARPHRRRRSSQRRVSFDHDQGKSPALLSVQDLIAEIKRLPHTRNPLDHSFHGLDQDASDEGQPWQHSGRRHSEPTQHQLLLATDNTIVHPFESTAALADKYDKQRRLSTGGHLRKSSDRMDTPRQSAGGMRSRSQSLPGDRLQPLTPTSDGKHEASQRRALYPAYLSASEATELIRARKLFAGTLRVSHDDSSNANVICKELGPIYIYGSRRRNRAVDGDVVAVELTDVDTMLAEKAMKKQSRSHGYAKSPVSSSFGSSWRPLSSIPEGFAIEAEPRPQYCGHIVCVLDRPRNLICSGMLSLARPSAAADHGDRKIAPKIVWFIPADKRLPLVAIPVKHAPSGFVKYHEEYRNRVFICNIQRWPVTSLHPFGTIEREIGWVGELDVHKSALVADYHITDTAFSDAILRSTAAAIKHASLTGRLDFGGETFVLPELDLAFSVKEPSDDASSDDVLEVGVHIPDVAHYIQLNSPLDRNIRERATDIKLMDHTIPILPSQLTDHCRFVVATSRAAFSIVFRINKKGVVLHTWIGQTIIKPTRTLSLQDVQSMVDDDMDLDPFHHNITTLIRRCQVLQRRRHDDGGQHLASSRIRYMVGENGYPSEVEVDTDTDNDVSILLQELVMLANREVAVKISRRYENHALLVRQEEPLMADMDKVRNCLREHAPLYDISTVNAMYTAVEAMADDTMRAAILCLLKNADSKAEYFCAGSADISTFRHCRLHLPIYTTMNEPLQNYASIAVQRQLTAALKGELHPPCNYIVEQIALHCNARLDAKQSCEKDVHYLYTAAYLYNQILAKGTPLRSSATVVAIQQEQLRLYFDEFDILIDVKVDHGEYQADGPEMTLTWHETDVEEPQVMIDKDGGMTIPPPKTPSYYETRIQTVNVMSTVDVRINVNMRSVRPIIIVDLVSPFSE